MSWRRIGAVLALVVGALAFVVWKVVQAQGEKARLATKVREDLLRGIEPEKWEHAEVRVRDQVDLVTTQLEMAKVDEIKALFEAAFPRKNNP